MLEHTQQFTYRTADLVDLFDEMVLTSKAVKVEKRHATDVSSTTNTVFLTLQLLGQNIRYTASRCAVG